MGNRIDEAMKALKAARAELVRASKEEGRLQTEHFDSRQRVTDARLEVEKSQCELEKAIDAQIAADEAAAELQLQLPSRSAS